ncbi:hypothetical protein ON010_g11913 [Phytophthora cinnamomi]|nr:hypothetical protein ON010_g11913 [Phytophthora cinnamomi]
MCPELIEHPVLPRQIVFAWQKKACSRTDSPANSSFITTHFASLYSRPLRNVTPENRVRHEISALGSDCCFSDAAGSYSYGIGMERKLRAKRDALMAFGDQVRALSATPIGEPKRQLRRAGGDGANTNEAILVNEDRGLLDGVAKLAAKLGTKLTDKISILTFKAMRKLKLSPQELEAAARATADPVKRAKQLEAIRHYGFWYVQKADANTFKALYYKSKLGPKSFFQAVKQQMTTEERQAYLAMAKRYRSWVADNNLNYF